MENYEIRAKARQDLGEKIFGSKWMYALAASLIYSAIIGGVSAIPGIGQVASLLLSGPLLFGIVGYYLKLADAKDATLNNLFDGFNDFSETFLLGLMTSIFTFLWALLFIIPGIIKSYAYSMAFYIKHDNPSYTWKQCLDESQKLMDGHKWKLFCLHFSFIGWIFVCIFTFGIGLLWLSPYMEAANANFYRSLKPEQSAQSDDFAYAKFDGSTSSNGFESF